MMINKLQKLVLAIACVFGGGTLAQEEVEVRKSPPLEATWQLTIKDSRNFQQMVQKNVWFQEFRQTPFYYGAIQKISPVLFSLADEYGPSAQSWKGRLLDYAYEKIIDGQPVLVSYYNRASLVSPIVISLFDIPDSKIKAATALIKVFRSAEDKEIELKNGMKAFVTPLLIRNQKFAVSLMDKCLIISRDPQLVALQSLNCKNLKKPSLDGIFEIKLSQQFPALNGVREKFLATGDVVTVNLKWNSSDYKYQPLEAGLPLKENNPFQKKKMNMAVVKSLPADSFFYLMATLPSFGSLNGEGVKSYFSEDLKTRLKRKPTTVTLFYSPFLDEQMPKDEEEESNKNKPAKSVWKLGTALLLHYPGVNQKVMEGFSELMKTDTGGEVFMRPVCGEMIVLSNQKGLIKWVDQVCSQKRASFAELDKKMGQELTQKEISGAFYFAPGKMISKYIQQGWSNSKNAKEQEEIPNEIRTSQAFIEKLPEYLFAGLAEKKQLTLKSNF